MCICFKTLRNMIYSILMKYFNKLKKYTHGSLKVYEFFQILEIQYETMWLIVKYFANFSSLEIQFSLTCEWRNASGLATILQGDFCLRRLLLKGTIDQIMIVIILIEVFRNKNFKVLITILSWWLNGQMNPLKSFYWHIYCS